MARVKTFQLEGLEARLVELEVTGPGRVRILSPRNLAPADLKKDAGGFDLPIALALLVATGQLLPDQLKEFATVGELALDGSVRPIKGALSMAIALTSDLRPDEVCCR
jgi:predicted ATPase with chaperone activity